MQNLCQAAKETTVITFYYLAGEELQEFEFPVVRGEEMNELL